MLKKGDILLLLLIVFGIALTAVLDDGKRTDSLSSWSGFSKSDYGDIIAIVKKDGEIIKTINLTKLGNREIIDISGQYNETIIAENSMIRFNESDCPDDICVKSGWLSKPGQVALCLPNKVLIKVIQKTEENLDELIK